MFHWIHVLAEEAPAVTIVLSHLGSYGGGMATAYAAIRWLTNRSTRADAHFSNRKRHAERLGCPWHEDAERTARHFDEVRSIAESSKTILDVLQKLATSQAMSAQAQQTTAQVLTQQSQILAVLKDRGERE